MLPEIIEASALISNISDDNNVISSVNVLEQSMSNDVSTDSAYDEKNPK